MSRRRGPSVVPAALAALASCCRDRELVSFDCCDRDDARSARRVEPHPLVTVRGHWYLLAHDPDRADWRTFRVNRIAGPRSVRHRFPPRELPAPDAVTHLTRSFAGARYRHTARLTVWLPAETVRAGSFAARRGEIAPSGPDACTLRVSADSAALVVQYIAAVAALGAEFALDAPEEITRRVRDLGRRLTG